MALPSDIPMLEVVDATHCYGPVKALDGVSLTAEQGEFLTILGESGSGKTTMLRVISGLERPTSIRRLAIAGEDVSTKPAAMRNCTTVFQSYALFPHMSVGENVSYGLRVRGVARDEARDRVARALHMVRLDEKGGRRINQLSGGERQRVALARALVTQPAILLLDEPLGALDEKLRLDMQSELVEIQRSLGMTFIYITHSQEEALTMSDRVILMRKGRIEQSGTPVSLFDRPLSRFVAEFMGFDNILPAVLAESRNGEVVARIGDGEVRGVWTASARPSPGDAVLIAVRAERLQPIRRADAPGEANVMSCRPEGHTYRGKYVDMAAAAPSGKLKVRIWDPTTTNQQFDAVSWKPGDCVVLPN